MISRCRDAAEVCGLMKRVAIPYSRSQLHFIFRMMHPVDMRYPFGPAADMESLLAGALELELS